MAMIPKSEQTSCIVEAEIPPLPLLNRRSKVRTREVNSRFMSPLMPSKAIPTCNSTTSPAPDSHQLNSSQRWHHVQERNIILNRKQTPTTPCSKSVEKWQHEQEQGKAQSFELDARKIETTQSTNSTPAMLAFGSHNLSDNKAATSVYSGKGYQQRLKPLKENSPKAEQGHATEIISQTKNSILIARSKTSSPSPYTSSTLVTDRDRIVPSRYKLNSPHSTINKSNDDMAILLQKKLSRMTSSADDSSGSTATVTSQAGGSCPSSPFLLSRNRLGTSDVYSSLQEMDMLANRSTSRSLSERNSTNFHVGENINGIDCSMIRAFPCSRSLDFQASNSEHASSTSLFRLTAGNLTAASTPFKPPGENYLGLPPHPSSMKPVPDSRKGRKHYEDVHFLKLLSNHYLKWRFVNARAEVLMCSQEMETKKQLNSLGGKLSEMRTSVGSKRVELEYLRRRKALATVVNSQMPYLKQWSAMEKDYATYLSEILNSLSSLSLRLPISSEVKVDMIELGEALNLAMKTMEMMVLRIKSFVSMAEETESLISELARVTTGERVLIHECGARLINACTSQVEECSLRGHLIQLCHT